MEKINVAELLKDCQTGMELDCTITDGEVIFECVAFSSSYPISVVTKDGFHHKFTKYGEVYSHGLAKCVIFPKGKTTWEGFVPPYEFKDGDIIFTHTSDYYWISIFKQFSGKSCYTYIDLCLYDNDISNDTRCLCHIKEIITQRLATEEEKQKLFQAIKDKGYRWNEETKTLEKITANKFDITTLVPFESRVLVRGNEEADWVPTFWGYKSMTGYVTTFGEWRYCIPYKDNEHLLGTADDCDEHFKTWK